MAPPKTPAMTTGRIEKKAVMPVLAALPVVIRTNQGMASAATLVPTNEIALAP